MTEISQFRNCFISPCANIGGFLTELVSAKVLPSAAPLSIGDVACALVMLNSFGSAASAAWEDSLSFDIYISQSLHVAPNFKLDQP